MNNTQRSGLDCLKELLKQMHLNPDWDGIVNAEIKTLYDRDSVAALMKVGDAMEYQPNKVDFAGLKNYAGPALALLKNQHYVTEHATPYRQA